MMCDFHSAKKLASRVFTWFDILNQCAECSCNSDLNCKVFFWHVLARSDVPKHLAEALADPAQPAWGLCT